MVLYINHRTGKVNWKIKKLKDYDIIDVILNSEEISLKKF